MLPTHSKNTGHFAKIEEVLCAQVLNSLILKDMDIAIFAAKFLNLFLELNVYAKSVLHIKSPQITEICPGKICGWMKKTGTLKKRRK